MDKTRLLALQIWDFADSAATSTHILAREVVVHLAGVLRTVATVACFLLEAVASFRSRLLRMCLLDTFGSIGEKVFCWQPSCGCFCDDNFDFRSDLLVFAFLEYFLLPWVIRHVVVRR